jgi:prevent-host-death family protein
LHRLENITILPIMTKIGSVTATEANRNFSALLDRVKRGEAIDITSHGKAVATIQPKIDGQDKEKARRLEAWSRLRQRLVSQDRAVIGAWTRAELYERD